MPPCALTDCTQAWSVGGERSTLEASIPVQLHRSPMTIGVPLALAAPAGAAVVTAISIDPLMAAAETTAARRRDHIRLPPTQRLNNMSCPPHPTHSTLSGVWATQYRHLRGS